MKQDETALESALKAQISHDGPLSVAAFMAACLFDPEHGYYATGAGLGRDFTTSPEISQVFGELVGLWAAHEWHMIGAPDPFHLIEIGPGRGLLMEDVLRATEGYRDFRAAAEVTLVETSPVLRRMQAERLGAKAAFMNGLSEIAAGPTLLIANEFLDCLPARQFIRDGVHWRERMVGLGHDGALSFGLSGPVPLPLEAGDAGEVEVQFGLDAVVSEVSARLSGAPGRALFIDYGPPDTTPGDSLRAFCRGEQVSPLERPGACDLTVDVDFSRLKRLGVAAGLDVHGPVPQGLFLQRLGAEARMQALVRANPGRAADIHAGVQRLVEPGGMGTAFQAICLSSPGLPPPAGLEPI